MLTMLMGLPGCGKTTVARRLRTLAPQLTVLSRDLVRREMVAHPDYSAGEKRAVLDELLSRTRRELADGRGGVTREQSAGQRKPSRRRVSFIADPATAARRLLKA